MTHYIVHQGNVLIDSTFHCQITDFGSTRHAETAVTQSTTAISVHFAAPELFGMCTNCCRPNCDGCHAGHRKEHTSKTKETDVYAFSSLYYAVRFRFSLPYYSIDSAMVCADNVPFHENNNLQVLRLVTSGRRPQRWENPRMEDNVWDLIYSCMETISPQRPTMEYILRMVTSFAQAGP